MTFSSSSLAISSLDIPNISPRIVLRVAYYPGGYVHALDGLHLDNLGAEVGQKLGAMRPGHGNEVGKVYNPEICLDSIFHAFAFSLRSNEPCQLRPGSREDIAAEAAHYIVALPF